MENFIFCAVVIEMLQKNTAEAGCRTRVQKFSKIHRPQYLYNLNLNLQHPGDPTYAQESSFPSRISFVNMSESRVHDEKLLFCANLVSLGCCLLEIQIREVL